MVFLHVNALSFWLQPWGIGPNTKLRCNHQAEYFLLLAYHHSGSIKHHTCTYQCISDKTFTSTIQQPS